MNIKAAITLAFLQDVGIGADGLYTFTFLQAVNDKAAFFQSEKPLCTDCGKRS